MLKEERKMEMSKKKKLGKKKKYVVIYDGKKLVAIAKNDKIATEYVAERYGLNIRSVLKTFSSQIHAEKEKFPEGVEEYEDFIREYKNSDIIESVREHRYRKLMMEEFRDHIKEQKKICKDAKKRSSKKALKELDSETAKAIKGHLKNVIKDAKEEIGYKEELEKLAISETIISDPNAVNEYLKSHEIIQMIKRGEI